MFALSFSSFLSSFSPLSGTRVDYIRPTTVTSTPLSVRNSFGLRLSALMGDELVKMLLETNEGHHDFALVQHCLVSPEKVLLKPTVLFPLIVRVVKAMREGKLPPKI
jgi:hypothetical protein